MARKEVGAALQEWRDAQRRLDHAIDGDRDALEAAVVRARNRFQRRTTNDMVGLLDELHEAESRRKFAVPSTEPFHQAAKDEMVIASEIWASARMNDRDTPQRRRDS